MIKNSIKKALHLLGYEIGKIAPFPPGAPQRPVGYMDQTLEDLKARGIVCKSILDIGANAADWSAVAKRVFPDAKFCLIEPQVEMEEKLKAFCNNSPGSIYFLAGAGTTAETKYLTIWDDMAGSSFRPGEDDTLKNSGKQRAIEMITVDDVIASGKFDIPELVKLDIQGYEIEALKGAESLFGKTEVFIMEVSFFSFNDVPGMPIFSDIMNFMLEKDYVIYDFAGFSRRPLDGALGQCDICFVKRNSFLRAVSDWG